MKGWIKFAPNEAPAEMKPHSWHKAVEVVVKTACTLSAVTDERPGQKAPGYGAKICQPCLHAKDEL
jgi:hypothetical protein